MRRYKGLPKPENTAVETLFFRQMLRSLAARDTYVLRTAETIFAVRTEPETFFPQVKNTFASQTQMLLPRYTFKFSHNENNVDKVLELFIKKFASNEEPA